MCSNSFNIAGLVQINFSTAFARISYTTFSSAFCFAQGTSPKMVGYAVTFCQAPREKSKVSPFLSGSFVDFLRLGIFNADMLNKPDISIIGPGVVGSALARLACKAGYRIAAVAGGSHPARSRELAKAVGGIYAEDLAEAAAAGQLVLLSVRDEAIVSVCEQLADSGGLSHKPIVAHCCGAMGSDALLAAQKVGCAVGSMHPLQTFPDIESALARLGGTYCFIEGDPKATDALESLAGALGGNPVHIDQAVKPLYHAAAVMGANYITTMLDVAFELLERTGLSRSLARKAIGPLVRATVENTLAKGSSAALTGPISRGDVETVHSHLAAMEKTGVATNTKNIYRQMGLHTIDIALAKGTIDDASAKALLKLLQKKD